jgi:hypothetical protein
VARLRVKVPSPEPVRTIEMPQTYGQQPPRHSQQPVQGAYHHATSPAVTTQGVYVSKSKLIWLIVLILLIVGLFTAYVNREKSANEPFGTLGTSETTQNGATEAQQYYNEISKYVELPTGEMPTVLNISDAEEVKKDNAALTDIKDGDKMLFFTKSRKLVVYRPSSKKVVAVVSLAAPAGSAPVTTPGATQ